ncbi:hypothetical protein [Streptomyces sp. FH025]|uniref:hypothetical protein n=1 Tax=Streptomyces sp. FH025 TaxID=2815937 RepID=UPI001A9E9F7C|nr:hypothetical protein [Streptomyces sp. FH025]MBO1413487.1 hypothetical protein [Streptomyces sp. FH025]
MSADTTDQLNDELHEGWENLRDTAVSIAELQTAMWGDCAELMAGLATGKVAWGEVYSEYWKFVADEYQKFALELSRVGIDYAQRVAEVTREHEQRLRDHLRGPVPTPVDDGTTAGGSDTGGGTDTKEPPSRSRSQKQ